MSASSDDLAHTERRFHIHSCLGRGGFGEVYRAMMVSPGGVRSEVALKVLRADIDPGSEAVARLRDEGRLLGAIRHPSILHVHDLVVIEGRVALVTEYVEGEDLDRCIVADPPLPVRALVMALSDVASALHAAWSSPSPITGQPIELVHRDIKPANIRIGRHGEVKLLDFGVARAVDMQREAHTADHAMMGSYLYMAPERFTDDIVEPASDVFALGCVLYEGLARRRYFHGMNLKSIYGIMLSNRRLKDHLDEKIAELPPLHEDLEALLRDLLASDPDARPKAIEAARRGEDLADDLTGSSLKRWARRREWPESPPTVPGSLDGHEVVASAYLHVPAEPEPEPRKSLAPGLPANVRLTPPPVREKRRGPAAEEIDPAPLDPAISGTFEAPPPAPLEPPPPAEVSPAPTQDRGPAEIPPVWPEPDTVTIRPTTVTETPELHPESDDRPYEIEHDDGLDDVAVEPVPLAMQRTEPPPPPRADVSLMEPDTEEAEIPEPIPYIEVSDFHVPPEPIPEVGIETTEDGIVRLRAERRRSTTQWLATAGLLLVVALLVGAWMLAGPEMVEELEANFASGNLEGAVGGDPRPVGAPAGRSVELSARAEAATASPPEAPPPPEPAPAAEPATPEPAPKPKAKSKPRRPNVARLHEQGWKAVDDGQLNQALSIFEDALRRDPRHADGLYGRGYTLMKLERSEEAAEALCKAIELGNAALRREVRSIMQGRGLSCP